MNTAQYIRIPALQDNYIWMLHNPSSEELAVIDPGDADAVFAVLQERALTPTEIINTHHHADHIAGNAELMTRFNIPLKAPAAESARIDNITHPVHHGDTITIAGYEASVIATPGHTSGHVAFFVAGCFDGHGIAFVGDTLFSSGCGRVFEGTMEEMWQSLVALRALPDDTLIACGHEYSQTNARYAQSLGWENAGAEDRWQEIHALRADNMPTVPVSLGVEKKSNPFLSCDTDGLASIFNLKGEDAVAVFTALRMGKDNF